MTRLDSSPRRFAALDLGSLTVRLAIAEKSSSGGWRVLLHRREITGLAQGLAQTGELTPEGMARTFRALQVFRQVLADHPVERYRAVATHAVRAAGNGAAFLERLRSELGLSVEVLPPEEEARLSLQGVLSALAPKYLATPILVFDVGGGSSEFALVRPGQEPRFASLPLGVLTLSQARPWAIRRSRKELPPCTPTWPGNCGASGTKPSRRTSTRPRVWWAPPVRSPPWRPCI